MGEVVLDKSMSLDGFITGPNPGPDNPRGDGGDRIFAWFVANQAEDTSSAPTRSSAKRSARPVR
jgi:hypothetical protein